MVRATHRDTTVRLTIAPHPTNASASVARLEWFHRPRTVRGPGTIIATTTLPLLDTASIRVEEPSSDVTNGTIRFGATAYHGRTAHPTRSRLHIVCTGPGLATAILVDNPAYWAARAHGKPVILPAKPRIPIARFGGIKIDKRNGDAESPWISLSFPKGSRRKEISYFGYLDHFTDEERVDGTAALSLLAIECCAGEMVFFESYVLDSSDFSSKIVYRTGFMNGGIHPAALMAVPDSLTIRDGMRLWLGPGNTGAAYDDDPDYYHPWRRGIALIPGSTAWIVAKQRTRSATWAYVVALPVLTYTVARLFISDNSSQAGTLAGWVKLVGE